MLLCLIDCRLRSRVNSVYRKRFATLDDAQIHYGLTLSDSLAELVIDKRQANSGKTKRPLVESEMSTSALPPVPPASTTATAPPLALHLRPQ